MQHLDVFQRWSMDIIEFSSLLLVFCFGLALLFILYLYIVDVTQKDQTIRRNYPVIGRFRYFFEHMGEFFRQYFFAMDREELPFNRAERSWAYRAAKNTDTTVAFGSTHPLDRPGDVIFVNDIFPVLKKEIIPPASVTVGEGVARTPFTTNAIINISAMSYGALSTPAVLALSNGAKAAGIWMNTGEGGLSDHHLAGGCDVIFQIGTAKYGVRDEAGNLSDERLKIIAAHEQIRMFEIKLSQGAKPGKGGILPGGKVTPEISAIRGIPIGEDSISPNGHTDIRSLDNLLDKIHHIREITGKPVGFKTVIGDIGWLEALCVKINERGKQSAPDFITVDSADGGTGAAPQSLMDFMGMPLKISLPLVVDTLVDHDLKGRIKLIASGKLINPSAVAWALCVGVDFVNTARGFMFSLGCIQALQCNKNTCPTGITTHNKKLQKGLDPTNKAERVKAYALNMTKEVEIIAHSCGAREPRSLRREHARIINSCGIPEPLEFFYPRKTQ